MTRVATAALLTLPGIPCLYSFDEVGAEFLPYSELHPITTDRPELRAFHKRWITLRRSHAALSGQGFTPLYVGEPGQPAADAYAYLRRDGTKTLLIVLNFSAEPAVVSLSLPRTAWNATRARDVGSSSGLAVESGRLTVQLGPWDSRAFEPF